MTSPRASLIRIAFSFIRPVSQPSITESPSQISGGFEAEIRSPIRRDRGPIFSRTHLSAKPPSAKESSQRTPRWRGMDSNVQFALDRQQLVVSSEFGRSTGARSSEQLPAL